MDPRNILIRSLKWPLLTFVMTTAVASETSFAAEPGVPPLGVWINHSGKGGIETYMCGKYLCGRIVWLRQPLTNSGKPMYDGNNPDPKKRTRQICGLTTILNLKPMTNGSWGDGQAYNPEEGKSYDVSVVLGSPDQLKVTGTVLFFSKTVHWTRAPADLPRCDVAGQSPAAPSATAPAANPAAAAAAPGAAPVQKPAVPVTAKSPSTKPAAPAGSAAGAPAKAVAPQAAKPAAAKPTVVNKAPVTAAPAKATITKSAPAAGATAAKTAPAAGTAKPATAKAPATTAPATASTKNPPAPSATTKPAPSTTAGVPKPTAATPPAKKAVNAGTAAATAPGGVTTEAETEASTVKKADPAGAAYAPSTN